ncbi:MAG TPA: tetratricopeptide repeat protein [Thermodesulfobacteriota bacterium]|nr:tetratricopeptide repeat protein [Thermodesulfobacteriota bacterium]
MEEKTKQTIKIDLNQFKFHAHLRHKNELTLHFDSPSRRFYLSVIAFVVNEMKKSGKITSIPLEEHSGLLALLNETIGDSAGSSEKEILLPRIYRKWKDALPDLENAPLFKVIGRKKELENGVGKTYRFTEGEKDSWANLFEYRGSQENVRLRFSIDKLGAGLDDIVISYEGYQNAEAWERFISNLRQKGEEKPKPADLAPKELETPVTPARRQKIALRGPWQWAALAVAIVLAVVASVTWRAYFYSPPDKIASVERMAFPLPDKPSIAVLPFVNMTDDPRQESFCDGLTEEIITTLSRIPKLFVIARSSMFTYKGKPVRVQQVAEELGIQYVLEGSVRRSGEQVRITAQLNDALTGRHLWAERYDRNSKDIFIVQDEITTHIITALQVKLTEGEQARVFSKGTKNLDALMKVTEARYLFYQSTIEGIIRARQLSEEAISLDPNYAFAYRALAQASIGEIWFGLSKNPQESLKKSIELYRKAIALDGSLAVLHAGLGYALMMALKYDEAISKMERALELEPNSADVVYTYANILIYMGRGEEAISFFRIAIRLNPKPPNTYLRHLAVALRDTGRYEEAIAQLKKAIEREPRDIMSYVVLASTYGMAGREKEARAAAVEVLKINPNFSLEKLEKIHPYKDIPEKKRYFDALRKVGLK